MEAAVDFYFVVPVVFTVLAVVLASVFVKLRSSKEKNKAATDEPDGGKEAAQVEEVEEEKKEVAPKEEKTERTVKEDPVEELKKEVAPKEEKKERTVKEDQVAPKEEKERTVKEYQVAPKEEKERTAKEDPVGELKGVKGAQEAPRGIQVEDIGTEEQILRVEEEADQEELAAATERVQQQISAPGFTVSKILAGLEAEDLQEAEDEAEHEKPVEDDSEMERFSFQYSPGKLRGSHFETMMTKEELEEEQRVQREQLAAIFGLMKENQETFGPMSEVDVKEQLKLYDM